MIINLRMGWLSAALFTLSLILSQIPDSKAAAASSSMIDVGRMEGAGIGNDLILNYRDISEYPVLQKASEIIKTKLAGSTPLVDAAVKLIQTCKTVNDHAYSSLSAGQVKDIAKDTYAIKATDASLDAAGVQSPKVCNLFGGQTETSWLSTIYSSPADPDNYGNPEVARARKACLGVLFKLDNAWTSYSNHKQDADSLCEISSVEHAPRMMLELLKDITEVVPSMVEMFRQQKAEHEDLMEQQRRFWEEMAEQHMKQLQDMQGQQEAAKHMTQAILDQTRTQAQDMVNQLHTGIRVAGADIAEMQKKAVVTINDVLTFRDTYDRIIQQFQSAFADATTLQVQGMSDVENSLIGIVRAVNEIHGGLHEQVEVLTNSIQVRMSGIADTLTEVAHTETEIVANQRETKALQGEVFQTMTETDSLATSANAKMHNIFHSIDTLASVLASMSLDGFLTVSGIASITILLLCFGLRRQAGIFASICALIVAASYLVPVWWSIFLPRLLLVFTTARHVLCNSREFIASRNMSYAWLIGSAVLLVLAYAIERHSRSRAAADEWPADDLGLPYSVSEASTKRQERAGTVAPDSLRPGSGRSQPMISKSKFLSEQQRLSLRMAQAQQSAV